MRFEDLGRMKRLCADPNTSFSVFDNWHNMYSKTWHERTRSTLILVTLALLLLIVAPQSSPLAQNADLLGLTPEEKNWLSKHKVIRLGVDPNFPPWEFIDENGKYSGIMPEYVRLVAERLDIEFEKVIEPTFKQLTECAKNKTLDVLPGLHITPERAKFLAFSKSYLPGIGGGFYVRVGFDPIPNEQALSGKTVAMVKGHALTEELTSTYPGIIPVLHDNVADVLEAVSIGGVDAGVSGFATATYEIRRLQITNLIVSSGLEPSESEDAWHMGVRDDWPILVGILDKALSSITEDEHLAIHQRWVSLAQPPEQKATIDLSAEEAAWLKDNPIIRVASAGDYAPIELVDARGNAQGISIEYFRWIEEALPIKFEITNTLSREDAATALDNGDIQLISAVGRSTKNNSRFRFTDPYVSVPTTIFTGPEVSYIGDLSELRGKKVAILADHTLKELITQDMPEIGLTPANNTKEALQRLSRGEVDAFIGDLLTTSYYLSELGLTQIKVAGETPYSTDLAMAVSNSQPLLAAIIQKALAAIPEVDRSAIRQRWITFRYEQGFEYNLLWKILIPILLATGLIVYWNRRLTGEVKLRRVAEAQLEEKNIQLHEQNMELDAYAHTIAHSLKTPLAATSRFLEILTKFKSEGMSAEQQHLASQALSTMEMSNETVDALLMLSTVSEEKIEEGVLDMGHLVRQALEQLRNEQERAQASISLPKSWPKAIGYTPWVGEVWLNYLSNALKYSGIPARLEVGGELDGPDQVRFWVRDAGRPLTDDEQQQLFVPFARLREDKGPGHGLGLTITKRIIEKLGGEVGVKALPEGGNEFYFTLPAARAYPEGDR